MAVTTIHAVRSTLNQAINYITNPHKTEEQKYIDGFKSYYELTQDRAGNSWKSKLRTNIDECIMTATSFEDFLEQMKRRGYEIKHGKHISFRAEGQERFTRGKTLGWYYDEDHIRDRTPCVK